MPEEPKPPYVRFETRSIEDRDASIEAGHYVGKDIIFAIVTPAGSRDQVERPVSEWLDNLREGVRQERIPAFWVPAYERALEDYAQSRETPENGVAIKDWPSATPAQIKTMLDLNVRTVEQLAEANEETVQRIGMGGRALKQKAIIWLQESKDQGVSTERMNALQTQNDELKARNEELTERLEKIEKEMAKQKEKA